MPAKTAEPLVPPSRSPRNERGGVRHFRKSQLAHLEDADLVRRAEAVFDRAQDPELVPALALETR